MKITNKERMTQLSSSIEASVFALRHYLIENHKEILEEKVNPIISNVTIEDILNNITNTCAIISGSSEDSKYYYADIDIGFTDDTFPVEH